jgi:hypothetical protein
MSKFAFIIYAIFMILFSSGCSKRFLISTGSKDHKPLLFNDEYNIETLREIEVNGGAFWGIPSFSKNNKNNHKQGMLFTFNGVQLFKTKRILPIITLISYSLLTHNIVQYTLGDNNWSDGFFTYENNVSYINVPSYIIGLPIAGMLNNLTWNNAAFSGASETFNYRLINENPEIDVFFYPKYEVSRKHVFSEDGIKLKYLWFQDATLRGKVKGARIINKP